MITKLEALIAEARDPDTPWTRMKELVKHPEVEVRRALLDNPNLCLTDDDGNLKTSLLKRLAEAFPEEVSGHPLFVLHALIEPNDEFQGVVRNVVKRTADVGLIEHAFRTWGPSWGQMRRTVAENPKTPEDLLRTLGNPKTEDDWKVRATVAENHNTPIDLLRTLGNQQTESRWEVRCAVAWNPNSPVDVLRTLGNPETESSWNVRRVVAQHPDAPVDLLRSLGNPKTESSWNVRGVVAQHPDAPVDLLRTLANPTTESDEDVRQAAQKALADRGLA